MTTCSEYKARKELVKANFPDVTFSEEEEQQLGFFLLEISTRQTKIDQLGKDLRTIAETLRYAGRNCCRNPKEREALRRVCDFARIRQEKEASK